MTALAALASPPAIAQTPPAVPTPRVPTLRLTLDRGPAVPAAGSELVSGLFTEMADAARLVLCTDGRSLPVAADGAFPDLQKAYRLARREPGQPVRVDLRARIEPRPGAEQGSAAERTVVVDRVEAVRPDERCISPGAAIALRGTPWRLRQLNGRTLDAASPLPESQIMVSVDGAQIAGRGACNRFGAPVQFHGGRIAIGAVAATRMACVDGQAQESELFAALERAATWQIAAGRWTLSDDGGRPLLVFEAAGRR